MSYRFLRNWIQLFDNRLSLLHWKRLWKAMSNLLSSVNIYIFVKEVTLQTFSDGGHLCICTVFQMGDTCVSVLFFRWGTLVYLYWYSHGGHLVSVLIFSWGTLVYLYWFYGGHLCICTDLQFGDTCVSVLIFRWQTLVYLYWFSDGRHLFICTDFQMGTRVFLYWFSDGDTCVCTDFQMADTCVSVLIFRWRTLVYLYWFTDGRHLCICTDFQMEDTCVSVLIFSSGILV